MTSTSRTELFTKIAAARQAGLIVVLEDIHDPHNAMAILRTCDAFGIQHVFFIFDQEVEYNPRNIGKASSSSANKWLTFHIFTSTEDCLKELKKEQYLICATALSPSAVTLDHVPVDANKIALVFGNEHNGISETMKQKADMLVQIPMYGFVQSINVSVTAGIVLHDVTTRRKVLTPGFRLSENEQHDLISVFQKK